MDPGGVWMAPQRVQSLVKDDPGTTSPAQTVASYPLPWSLALKSPSLPSGPMAPSKGSASPTRPPSLSTPSSSTGQSSPRTPPSSVRSTVAAPSNKDLEAVILEYLLNNGNSWIFFVRQYRINDYFSFSILSL